MKESCFKGCFCSKEGNGVNKVVMLNSFQHLHRFKSASKEEIPDQARDDNRRGFTLIELLVVVLIIGILAAIAVPQYRFAVDKSRISTYLPLVQSIVKAKQIYYLANGTWSGDLTKLDIDASKLCTNLTGNCKNELGSCQGNIGIDALCRDNGIILRYCVEGESCGSWTSQENIHITVTFSQDGSILRCDGNNNRGRKLCKWLKPD